MSRPADGLDDMVGHAVGRCSLGHVLVAVSERGVCAIVLGDDPEALTADLLSRFSNSRHEVANAEFAQVLAEVVRLVDDPSGSAAFSLPLDIRGTAFQRRVWEALRTIPLGQTVSYAELAAWIGAPRAARAVAAACAANRLAIAVPCHRVIAANGSLTGYRWGVERKRHLLEREKA